MVEDRLTGKHLRDTWRGLSEDKGEWPAESGGEPGRREPIKENFKKEFTQQQRQQERQPEAPSTGWTQVHAATCKPCLSLSISCNEMAQTRRLMKTEVDCSQFRKLRVWNLGASTVRWRPSFGSPAPPASSLVEGALELSGASFVRVIPFSRAPPSGPKYLPKAPPSNTVTLGLRIPAHEWHGLGGWGTHFQTKPLHECSREDRENALFFYSHKHALNLALPRKKTLRRMEDSCSWRSRCPKACFPSLPSTEPFKTLCKWTRHTPAHANTQLSSGRLPAYLRNFLFVQLPAVHVRMHVLSVAFSALRMYVHILRVQMRCQA